MCGVAGLYCGAVVVIYGQAADNNIVCTFLQTHHAVVDGFPCVLFDGHCLSGLGYGDDGAVTLFAHKDYVRAVYDNLLTVYSLAYEYLIWRSAVGLCRCALYRSLYALALIDYGIKVAQMSLGLAEHLYESVLVCPLGGKADADLVLRVILVCPRVIHAVYLRGTVAEPCIAVSALMAYVLQSPSRQAVTVTDVWLTVFQVIIPAPYRSRIGVFHQLRIAVHAGPGPVALYAQACQLVLVKPPHGSVHRLLHAVIGLG